LLDYELPFVNTLHIFPHTNRLARLASGQSLSSAAKRARLFDRAAGIALEVADPAAGVSLLFLPDSAGGVMVVRVTQFYGLIFSAARALIFMSEGFGYTGDAASMQCCFACMHCYVRMSRIIHTVLQDSTLLCMPHAHGKARMLRPRMPAVCVQHAGHACTHTLVF
jgi:hypothetical protein